MSITFALSLAFVIGAPGPPPVKPAALSTGKTVALANHLAADQPTVFVFTRPASSLEQTFARELRATCGARVGYREIHLKTGTEPVARQYEIQMTPTALVYDRRGRLTGRSSAAEEIAVLVGKAAQVMRIDWAEAGDPRLEEMEKVLGRAANSGIMRTFSFRPEWLRKIHELHRLAHQPDTALDRRTKEMIATYVSALNKCKF